MSKDMRKPLLIVASGLVLLFTGLAVYGYSKQTTSEIASSPSPSPTTLLSVDAPNTPATSPAPAGSLPLSPLAEPELKGSDFKVGRVLEDNTAYTRYYITYKSGDLTISGIMNKPRGNGPFPILVLNHGYIDPAIYTNGRGLRREQDYLSRQGYVVVHPDYRNHADSDKDQTNDSSFRQGYIEDSANLVDALKKSDLNYLRKDTIGMLGHSMGGGVTLGIMVTHPRLIKVAVLFAPVSASAQENFERYMQDRPELRQEIIAKYGSPETNPEFWRSVSAETYLGNVAVPVMIHHGTRDESTPLRWSESLNENLKKHGKQVTLHVYPGEPHEFTNAWPTVMQRTTAFINQYLK